MLPSNSLRLIGALAGAQASNLFVFDDEEAALALY
jgi:hypothetical protein